MKSLKNLLVGFLFLIAVPCGLLEPICFMYMVVAFFLGSPTWKLGDLVWILSTIVVFICAIFIHLLTEDPI